MKWHNTTFRGIFFLYTSSNTCSNIFYIKKMHDSIVQRKKKGGGLFHFCFLEMILFFSNDFGVCVCFEDWGIRLQMKKYTKKKKIYEIFNEDSRRHASIHGVLLQSVD
jgi:hypothetical protein